MLTNDDRQRAIEEEGAALGKRSKPKGRHLHTAVIVMLSVVLVMVIALLIDIVLGLGLFRG